MNSALPESVAKATKDQFEPMVRMLRKVRPVNAVGLLALLYAVAPNKIPGDPKLPPTVQGVMKAVLVSDNRNFLTMPEELLALDESFAQVQAAGITSFGDLPMIVLSSGARSKPDPSLGITDEEIQQAWDMVEEYAAQMAALSSEGRLIIAEESDHYIQVDQPEMVVESVREVVEIARSN